MNCLFINYSGYPKSLNYFCPDNGLALLSTILNRNNQHRAYVMDYCSLHYTYLWNRYWDSEKENCFIGDNDSYLNCLNFVLEIIANEMVAFIKSNAIQVVGFKLWTGEGFRGSSRLAEIIRAKFSQILIIAGGPHIDYFGHYIYEETDAFDCLVSGDGEVSLMSLLESSNHPELWHLIPNLIYKNRGILTITPKKYLNDLNENPTPDYSPEIYIYIRDKLNFFIIEDTRGCPNNCNYCIEPIKSGNRIRFRDVDYILEDIIQTKKKMNSNGFRFSCSTPHIGQRKILAKKITDRKLDVLYATFQTVKNVDSEYLKILKDSGCYNVFMGVESFSEKVLIGSYGKKQSLDEISNAIRNSKNAGIYTQVGLIYPSPIEDDETKKITFASAKELKPNSIFVLCPIVTPFTNWGGDPEAYNIRIPDASRYYSYSMNYDIKHTNNEKKWSQLNGITINGKSYDDQVAELSKLLKSLQESGIETQISIEIPILAHYSQQTALILNQQFHHALGNYDTHSLKTMILDLNDSLSKNNF